MKRTIEEINEKIRSGSVVVLTAEEIIGVVVTVDFLDGNHGLNTGDSIVIQGFPNEVGGTAITGINGVYTVTVTSATQLTYTSAESATSGPYICKAAPLRVWDHEFLAAKTTSGDGNYAYPVTACSLNVTAWTAGQATLTVMQG